MRLPEYSHAQRQSDLSTKCKQKKQTGLCYVSSSARDADCYMREDYQIVEDYDL